MTEHTNPNTDTMNRSEHQANVDMQRTAPAKWQAPSTCSTAPAKWQAPSTCSTAVVVGLALGAIFCGLYIIVTSL